MKNPSIFEKTERYILKAMGLYDVIIVGGGPAGLQCARILSGSSLRILLLEKKKIFGDKLCAGGLTLKDMSVLPLPDHVIEQKITRAAIHTRRRHAETETAAPSLFTVNRKALGSYQRSLLNGTSVEVRTGSQVTEIVDNRVVLKSGESCQFRYLVGADGYGSIVRRHLGLKVKKRLIGYQYTIPVTDEHPVLELFLDSRRFGLWYAWIFPHHDYLVVGCICDPDRLDHRKLKAGFLDWLKEKGIDPGAAILESFPISYDYRGVKFGNIFLAGEAAGLASGLSGEGIYQSLVSGGEVARMIMDPVHETTVMKNLLKYNRSFGRARTLLRWSGPLKGVLHELLLIMINREWIRNRINARFS